MKRNVHSVLLFVFVGAWALAPRATLFAYDPVPGGELLNRLRSPLFLATTENTASTESVAGDVVNPATSALKQRVHLDANYVGIVGDGSLGGHAVNGGVSVPTRVGVFTGSANYAQAAYDSLDLGQRGSVNVSFAKDLYQSLLFGTGIQTHFGANGGAGGFGVGLDLGIIHILGPVAGIPDLRWGAAISQLGLGYAPDTGTTGSPSPFTPSADIQATFVDSESVEWSVHTGFSAPTFQNLRYRAGSRLSFFDRVSLDLGWDIDLVEQTSSERNAGSLLPSVGITLRLKTDFGKTSGVISDQGWNRSDIDLHTAWAPLYDDVWAAGAGVQAALGVVDRNPPEVEIVYPETAYISPNNDGASDELLLPVEITDERFVTSWSLEITDESGAIVRRIENKEQRPENEGFQNIVDRLLYVKKGVPIPEEIRWDGRTDAGGIAPDGTYRFTVTGVDDNGNTNRTDEKTIVVDTTPPEATFEIPDEDDALIFSPNDDGSKDTLTVDLESSPEDAWVVEVLDSDDGVVYAETVESAAITEFTWDGRDSEGTLAPDGVYTLQVSATDRALNETTERLPNVIVDTGPTPVGLAIDYAHFSPNNDDRRDTVTFTPDVPVTEGIRSAEIVITDRSGDVRRTHTFENGTPESWTFDGSGDDGSRLSEGTYRGELRLLYRNGNRPTGRSPEIVLDVTPPRATVRATTPVFSPNGDGRIDSVRFLQTTDEAERWIAVIASAQAGGEAPSAVDPPAASDLQAEPDAPIVLGSNVVRAFQWSGTPADEIEWDGRNEAGETVPDGSYRYTLLGEDRAGNIVRSTPIELDLDTRETPVFVIPTVTEEPVVDVTGGNTTFSPNGDGVQDEIYLATDLADPRGAERFEMEILDETDTVVARVSGVGVPERNYPWDGRRNDGTLAGDGEYRARLTVSYRHGNRPQAQSTPFTIDTTPPEVSVAIADETRVFSPDGDGDKDTILLEQRSSREKRWNARIVRARDGATVRSWELSGELEPIEWDGTDDDGEIVPDDAYRYEVVGVDDGGNLARATTPSFRSDTREIEIGVRISEEAFSPNNDGVLDEVTISPQVNTDLDVSAWSVAIFPDGETPDDAVFTRDGDGGLQTVRWDGTDDAGRRLPDGSYRAVITAQPVQREEPMRAISARSVRIDTVAPSASVSLSEQIISPNGDGRLDELMISQETSREERWVGTISDEDGREVGRWEWVGTPPEQLRFSGLDTNRRRVADGEYTYQITATDAAGNVGSSEPAPFEVYTVETPLRFYAQTPAFSPNGDGTQDRLPIVAEIAHPDDIVSWEYRILPATADGEGTTEPAGESDDDARSAVLRRSGNAADLPEDFSWNGRTTAGGRAPERAYRAELTLTYRHGNVAEARTDAVDLDVTPPAITVEPDFTIFSPDDDGDRDAIVLEQESDPALGWTGEITGPDGDTVREFTWNDTVDSVTWGGTDEAGNVLPDGRYRYTVRGTDRAGNTAEASVPAITIDTRPVRLYVTVDSRMFSPNGDGIDDELTIGLINSRTDGAEERAVDIIAADGTVVRTFESRSVASREQIVWDGSDQDGTVSDGPYTIRYRVAYDNGARPFRDAPQITLDTQGPELSVDLDGLPFSPDNDGLNDELGISLDTSDATGIDSWSFEILDRTDKPFYRFDGNGEPRRRLVWDGRSTDGETVISAEDYPYRFTATDLVGNTRIIRGTIPIDILVIRDGDLLKVQISNINFEPNSPELQIDPDTTAGAKNLSVLDRLVEVFDKYQAYEIRVEGHAVNVTQTEREEREELQPLSLSRAEAVRTALIERGMEPDRISTLGRGGTAPIVPHTDLENRWKNRRVEFILIR
ncbi:MAG: FlgD immunoglobulin-like domain containing protein [Alkalispirochaeta sp.]